MSDLQDIIVTSSVKAFNSGLAHGVNQERERIIELLQHRVDKLETMRPESYKSVADKMDLRITTTNNLIKLIKGEISE